MYSKACSVSSRSFFARLLFLYFQQLCFSCLILSLKILKIIDFTFAYLLRFKIPVVLVGLVGLVLEVVLVGLVLGYPLMVL